MISSIIDTTLICSVHHRRVPPFEKGIQLLSSIGFNHIWIIESGNKQWGLYSGPYELYKDIGINNIFMSLMKFWKGRQLPEYIERVVLLDNDLCILDPKDTLEYLTFFTEQQYDLATLSSYMYPYSNPNNDIIIPLNFAEYHNKQLTPGGIAYSVFSRKLWDQLPEDLWMHRSTTLWSTIVPLISKFGVHRMDFATIAQALNTNDCRTYSQFEIGRWMHIGNLMTSYYNIERDMEVPGQIRRGYFCKYFPKRVNYSIEKRREYLAAWNQFTQGHM